MFIDWERERERERGRERTITVREKHWSVASCSTLTGWGSNTQPRYVSWLGIEPASFWCTGQCSNQLSHRIGPRSLFRHFFLIAPPLWNFNTKDILYICFCTLCTILYTSMVQAVLITWEEGYSTLFSLLLCLIFYSFFRYKIKYHILNLTE